MNSRELIRNMFAGRAVDRVPVFEYFWPETLPQWMAEGYPARSPGDENAAPKPMDPSLALGLDMMRSEGVFDRQPFRGHDEIIQETEEWVIHRNGAGAAFKNWKHKSGTPEHIDFRMSSRDIWERDYRSHLLELDLARLELPAFRESYSAGMAAGKWVFFGRGFVWETMRESLGDVCMYESLLLDPGWILDFNRVYTDFFKTHYQALIDQVGMPDGIWLYEDLGYRCGLFASPRVLRQLVLPFYAELVAFFHAKGLPVVLHSCGNITQALPLFIEAGFDGLHPMEVKAGCDHFAFAERYGDRLVLCGGLDVRILETNDCDTIRREVAELMNGMKAREARYILASDHSISPLVRYDSYRYMLDVYREHMML